MAVTEYNIITANHPGDLNAAITNGGYTPIGGVFSGGSYGMQAVGVGKADRGDVTEYEVLYAAHATDLVDKVNAAVKAGKQPIGGVSSWAHAVAQAVGKVAVPAAIQPTTAVKIEVSDPPDSTLLQKNFDALTQSLKSAGVYK